MRGIAFVALLAVPAPAFAAPPPARMLAASAVSTIAKLGHEADLDDIAALLRLPDMKARTIWTGPANGSVDPIFLAFYKTASSSLGIEQVSLRWQPVQLKRQPYLFRDLEIIFAPASCPTMELLQSETGRKSEPMLIPGGVNGRTHVASPISLPQPNGEAVQLSVSDDAGCTVRITRFAAFAH